MKNSNLLYGMIGVLVTLVIVLGTFAVVESRSKTVVLKLDAPNAPSDQTLQILGDARNSQRRADISTILNAVYQYAIDNDGKLPASIPTTPTEICLSRATACSSAALPADSCRSAAMDCSGLVNLDLLVGSYLVGMPRDPATNDPRSTKYTIMAAQEGHQITVAAPAAERGQTILLRRSY
jgi:hypothetical protein